MDLVSSIEADYQRTPGVSFFGRTSNTGTGSFAKSLVPGSALVNEAERSLRDAIGRVVGNVFFGTLLHAVRASAPASGGSNFNGYGRGGRGEEVFQAQLDQFLAEESGRAYGTNLTDAIVYSLNTNAASNSSQHAGSEIGEWL